MSRKLALHVKSKLDTTSLICYYFLFEGYVTGNKNATSPPAVQSDIDHSATILGCMSRPNLN